jgi:alpha-glucosidase (family GH31 glycosyl hydrolase)
MSHALELGYKGFMYDYGEYIDRQTVSHDGTTGEEMHNLYPLLYQVCNAFCKTLVMFWFILLVVSPLIAQKAAFDFFERLDDDPNDAYAPDFVYYVRSGYTGMQKYTWAHWTGKVGRDTC